MAEIFTDPKNADYLSPTEANARPDDRQLVAVYDTSNGAHLARDALLAAGIPSTFIHVVDRVEPQTAGTRSSPDERRATLLKTIGSLFSRSERPARFHLAEDPNHALVILDRGVALDRVRARQILTASRPVEIYECA